MLELIKYVYVILALLIGVFGWVWVNVFSQTDMIFSWYYQLIEKLPFWISKPLGTCDLCFAGQIAFWVFLLFLWPYYQQCPFHTLIMHFLYTTLAIFTVFLINKYVGN